MAKVKVYSRLPNAIKFTFQTYVGEGARMSVTPEDDEKTIVLNGTSEVVNHTLIVKEGAVTIFGYPKHDLAKRVYTADDLERLKADPTFQKLLVNGDVAIDALDDLSKDFTGNGKLTAEELRERMAKQKSEDGDISIMPRG